MRKIASSFLALCAAVALCGFGPGPGPIVSSGTLQVPNNTQLRQINGGTAQALGTVIRLGFAAAGDAQPLLLTWQLTCPSAPDNLGFLIAPISGGNGCWQASYGTTLDPREFGCEENGTSDDLSCYEAIDTAEGLMAIQPIVSILGTSGMSNSWVYFNIHKLQGVCGQTTFTLIGTPGDIGDFITANGSGTPVYIDCVTIVQPTYAVVGTIGQPANGGNGLVIGQAAEQTTNVLLQHVKVVGGNNMGVLLFNVADAKLSDVWCDRPWSQCLNINGARTTSNLKVQSIRVDGLRADMPGQEAIATPDDIVATTAQAVRDITVTNSVCNSAGWAGYEDSQGAHSCYAFAGSTQDQFTVDVICHGGAPTGCVSLKKNTFSSTYYPNELSETHIRAVWGANQDSGTGIALSSDDGSGSATPGQYHSVTAEGWINYSPPGVYQASTNYRVGDTVQNSGCGAASGSCVYVAIKGGETASSGGGPTSQTTNTGFADGTVIWEYLYPFTATATAITAGELLGLMENVVIDLHFNEVATGLLVTGGPVTVSSNVIQNVSATLKGTVQGNCYADAAAGVQNLTITALHLNGDCNVIGTVGQGELSIGAGSGGYYNNYTGLVVTGTWVGGAWGIYTQSAGSSVAGTISGAHFEPKGSCMSIAGGWTIVWDGGGACVITDSNGDTPFYATGSSATGSFTFYQPISIRTDAGTGTSAYPAWSNNSSSAVTFSGRFIRGYAGSAPSYACNYGDEFLLTISSSSLGDFYCSTASTSSGTWTQH